MIFKCLRTSHRSQSDMTNASDCKLIAYWKINLVQLEGCKTKLQLHISNRTIDHNICRIEKKIKMNFQHDQHSLLRVRNPRHKHSHTIRTKSDLFSALFTRLFWQLHNRWNNSTHSGKKKREREEGIRCVSFAEAIAAALKK
jgi:hypothetical protein